MSIRDDVRTWLSENWEPGKDLIEFRTAARDAGWLVPTWSEQWFGRGLSTGDAEVVGEEFERVGAPGRADVHHLHARVLYELGNDAVRDAYLARVLTGETVGCLLYSEPGAGSDLAGLRTSAVRREQEWVVNGQKVWTSHATRAGYGLLAARTDPTQPKHRGMTFFVIPMDQPGIEVRPIVQITGDQDFNEVFLDDAVVDDSARLGEVGEGWAVLVSALGIERQVLGGRSGSRAGDPAFIGTQDDLLGMARRHGRTDDPVARQALAEVYAERAALRLTGERYRAEGRGGPAATSITKLIMSQLLHRTAEVRRELLGPAGLLDEHTATDAPTGDAELANFFTLDAYFTSIGGGTDQIQRNIVSERLLGLPREADESKSVPFNEVRT